MKLFFISLTLLAITLPTKAQTDVDSVKATITMLFTGMKNSDVATVKAAFADSGAIMQTISLNKQGNTVVLNETVDNFANTINKLPKGAADEQIVFDIVKIDGPLAIVWTPYNFYYNGAFSHCGVNSFQLVKLNGQWKIQYIIDTRRKKGCE
jgi:hypothetical protein